MRVVILIITLIYVIITIRKIGIYKEINYEKYFESF